MGTPEIPRPEFFRRPLDYPDIPYDRMLSHAAAHWPENVAVVFGTVTLSYRELEALANRFARALSRLGVKKGDRVCLLTANCPEYVIAFYAIARIGAVVSPMNPSYREREIAYQLEDSDAVAIVVHNDLLPLVEAVRDQAPQLRHVITIGSAHTEPTGRALRFAGLIRVEPASAPPPVPLTGDDLLALPYSSGTTGLP